MLGPLHGSLAHSECTVHLAPHGSAGGAASWQQQVGVDTVLRMSRHREHRAKFAAKGSSFTSCST